MRHDDDVDVADGDARLFEFLPKLAARPSDRMLSRFESCIDEDERFRCPDEQAVVRHIRCESVLTLSSREFERGDILEDALDGKRPATITQKRAPDFTRR